MYICCRPRGFPPINTQLGILGPGPALPRHMAVRFMHMRRMPPMAFPIADMQRLPFDPSLMPLPPTEVLNGNIRQYMLQTK